jgi:hypothetical protein
VNLSPGILAWGEGVEMDKQPERRPVYDGGDFLKYIAMVAILYVWMRYG